MSGAAAEQRVAFAGAVSDNLEGNKAASILLDKIRREHPHPDALLHAFVDLEDREDVRRGFCRALQKQLERLAT